MTPTTSDRLARLRYWYRRFEDGLIVFCLTVIAFVIVLAQLS